MLKQSTHLIKAKLELHDNAKSPGKHARALL